MRVSDKLKIFVLLTVIFCLVLMPTVCLASGTDASDVANNIFIYADDASGNQVLLKVIPLDTIKSMAHGNTLTGTDYYGSFIDAYPTPTYLEGKGITIPELLDYVKANSTVANAGSLTYAGSDKLYFVCCDKASINFTYDALLGVPRYYYPDLYNNWDKTDGEVSDVDAILNSTNKIAEPVYLATESAGGRVFDSAGGTMSGYIAANDDVVSGCLANQLSDAEALRLIFPQKASDIENSTTTYSNIKKWVYRIRLKESDTSPITSLGTLPDPTCTFTLDGTTLTITMSCEDEDASIYYSNIDGLTTTPVNLYTGPITIEDYDTSDPFTIGLISAREGYDNVDDIDPIVEFSSANYVDGDAAPNFTYALTSADNLPKVGTAFDLSASLTADKDYTLYGAEYRVAVPAAYTVNSVTAATGWQYGTATGADNSTIVTFAYLNTTGTAETASSAVPVGTINLTPVAAGDTSVTVSEAIVTKSDASAYTNITAAGLSLTVGSNILLGDVNGDGVVSITDVLKVCQAINGAVTLTVDQQTAADVSKDGVVSIKDALYICKYINGIITSF